MNPWLPGSTWPPGWSHRWRRLCRWRTVPRGPTTTAEHGQPSEDDAHVALIIAGAGVRPGRYSRRVQVADIAPTLARLLGVPPLETLDGRVLSEALRR